MCSTSCDSDTQCADQAYCTAAGACELLLEQGNACTQDSACPSGECVDGVCCDKPCSGQCEACDVAGHTVLLISGTASVGDQGETVHVGDFRAQLWRTFRNIAELLKAEDMTWHDIVRTTCYLRDIERDYEEFNEIRTAFYDWLGLDPLPASTGIQARICRSDLLVEIEAIAVRPPTDT